MPTTRIKLTDSQRRELLWFSATGKIDDEIDLTGRQNDQQKALEAKGLITIQRSDWGSKKATARLTEDGLKWLEGDDEASEQIAAWRAAEQRRNAIARRIIADFEALIAKDKDIAALFSRSGFVSRQSLYTPGGEAFTEHQLEGVIRSFTDYIEDISSKIEAERHHQKFEDDLAADMAYLRDHNLTGWVERAKQLGITQQEFRAGFEAGLFKATKAPFQRFEDTLRFDRAFYGPLDLTPDQRELLRQKAMLNRTQAAERLGIKPAVFDRLKAKAGIKPGGQYTTREGYLGYLYSLVDVDSLKPLLK